MDQRFLLLF